MPNRRACGVYIFDEAGRVLLTQRGPGSRLEFYKWEGPGGAVEPHESFEDAAHREIREELGIAVTLERLVSQRHAMPDGHGGVWDEAVFTGVITETPAIQEPDKCVGFGWFTKEDIRHLPLAHYCYSHFRELGWLTDEELL